MAQLTVNKDYKRVEKPSQKPKEAILLEAGKIDCSYTTGSNSSSSSDQLSASPSPSPHGSLQGSGILTGSGSGSGTITSTGNMHPFNVVTKNGGIHEFLSKSENRMRRVQLLQLLILFPNYSTIQDEPTNKHNEEFLRSQHPKR